MYITPDEWMKMDKSIKSTCVDLPENTGISIVLWKLRALMAGYEYALSRGYTGTIHDERETNP